MFLTYGANLWYLAGIRRNYPQLTDENAYGDYVCGAYIGAEDGIRLVAPRMGGSFFQGQTEHKPWITDVRIIDEREVPRNVLREVIETFGSRDQGVSIDDRSWAITGQEFQNLMRTNQYSLASEIIAPMRMIKDREEIETMQRAGEVTDRAYAKVLSSLREGMTERDVESEVDRVLSKTKAEYPSFTTHVTFTKPGEGNPTGPRAIDRTLQRGHSVCFDFGVCYEGYCSDFGRTAFIGEPPSEVRRIHDLIMDAQSRAIKGWSVVGSRQLS